MGAFTPLLAIGTAGGAPIYAAGSLGAALGTGALPLKYGPSTIKPTLYV